MSHPQKKRNYSKLQKGIPTSLDFKMQNWTQNHIKFERVPITKAPKFSNYGKICPKPHIPDKISKLNEH